MRIALLQTAGDPSNEPEANIERLNEAAARAKAGGADLLLAPEMFLTGYAIGAEAASAKAETLEGRSARHAAVIAHQHGIALAYGFPERGIGGAVYNTALLIDHTGRQRLAHRKTHLFGPLDRSMFAAGEEHEVVQLASPSGGHPIKVGLLICYDVEFPETVRALALAGAELVIVLTANMKPFDKVSHIVVPTRALENGVFVAYANRCGSEADFDYLGLSCVGSPAGENIVLAGDGEELLFADIDLGEIARARAANNYLHDRRPGLYGTLAAALPETAG